MNCNLDRFLTTIDYLKHLKNKLVCNTLEVISRTDFSKFLFHDILMYFEICINYKYFTPWS